LAHHSKKEGEKKNYGGSPKKKVLIGNVEFPPLWPSYRGERRRTFGKSYGIKMRCYAEHVGGTHWKPGEHIGNLMGTHWKPKGNTLGTREKWEKFPCLKINF
jgi:hypothetical protein